MKLFRAHFHIASLVQGNSNDKKNHTSSTVMIDINNNYGSNCTKQLEQRKSFKKVPSKGQDAITNKEVKFKVYAPAVFALLRSAVGISDKEFIDVSNHCSYLFIIILLKQHKIIRFFKINFKMFVHFYMFLVSFCQRSKSKIPSVHCKL